MKPAVSLNVIDEDRLGNIDMHNLPSIPPGCDKLHITGLLKLHLKIVYLQKYNNSVSFKVKLWGSERETLIFQTIDNNQAVLNLNIRSSLEKVSKYLSDMGALCIECYIPHKQEASQINFGWIFVNFKRYIINFVLSEFEQTANILDKKKNKIGEIIASLHLQFYKKDIFYPIVTQPEISQEKYTKGTIQNRLSFNLPDKNEEQYGTKKSILHQRQKMGDTTSRKEESKMIVFEDMAQKSQRNRGDESWRPDFARKGKALQFLEEYNRNKPEHTQLSLIRQKFGNNCPSIELMKLKLDQAMLLSKHQQEPIQESNNVHLLLKCLKNQTKTKFDYLTITCKQYNSNMRIQTKINLNDQINNRVDINHLYVLPRADNQDILIFQIKDAKVQMNIGELKNKDIIEIKSKNGRRAAVIDFAFISETFIARNSLQKQEESNKIIATNTNDSCYIKIEGWPQDKLQLKNKKVGVVVGSKLIYSAEREQDLLLQIQLQSPKGQKHNLRININHLYKQQNYILNGKQVKIISAKGKVSDLLLIASKIDHSKEPNTQPQMAAEQDIKEQIDIKDLTAVFQSLQKCKDGECNEIMQSLSTKTAPKQIMKLCSIIGVNHQMFQQLAKELFNNNYSDFFKAYLAYHHWNHRYILNQKRLHKIVQNSIYCNELQKTVRRLKRSSDVLFGMVSSHMFISQFLKFESERPITQQTQSQFNREELAKLIILLFQRYPAKYIKLSELDEFFNNFTTCNHLNTYLLSKMSNQIIDNTELFAQFVSQSSQLISIFKDDSQGEWGLAKLLLTNQEQSASSSIAQSQLSDRKPTQPINSIEQNQGKIKTEGEQLRQPTEPIAFTEHSIKQKLAIIISSIVFQKMEQIQQIMISSEFQSIKLYHNFPQTVELVGQSANKISITTVQNIYEGVFIANLRPQRIQLFKNGNQAGTMQLFSQDISKINQDEQVAIRIQSTQRRNFHIFSEQKRKQMQELQVKIIIPVAKSPFVRLTVRSVRPTRPNYRMVVHGDFQMKHINFPNENQILLKNCSEWKIEMIDEQLDDISISNHITSNPYCFTDNRDKKVMLTAIIEITQCWDPELTLGLKQSIHFSIHFDHIISAKPFQKGQYSLHIEGNEENKILLFNNLLKNEKASINQSILINKFSEKTTVRVIDKRSKQVITEFHFTLKLIERGLVRNSRYLISVSKGFRMHLTIFQIRHTWQYCKPDRILTLFTSQNRRIIESWIKSTCNITEERLILWLRSNFQLTLTEINIIMEEILNNQIEHHSINTFLSKFHSNQIIQMPTLSQIKEQFNVFDYNDEGIVSDEQLKISKKVLNRNYKNFYSLLIEKQQEYICCQQRRNNFIIDLSSAIKSSTFDYLSFLDIFQKEALANNKQAKPEISKRDNLILQGSNLQIRIVQFESLSINKMPCTFLFKVNNQILADPIHKCYSFKYNNSNSIIVQSHPQPQLHVYLQTLKSNGLWDYKLLETLILKDHIKIFGGIIKFSIKPTNKSKSSYQRQAEENYDLNSNFQHSHIKKNQIDRSQASKEFTKSVWNKSLNETRQKWLQWKQNRKNENQIRKQLQFDEE